MYYNGYTAVRADVFKRGLKRGLKRVLYPAQLLGRFAISPLEERMDALEARLHELQLSQSLMYKAATQVAGHKIAGDYLEFGVYSGNSFVRAFRSLEEAFKRTTTPGMWYTEADCRERWAIWQRMRFYAFDSFQGLPRPAGVDAMTGEFVEGAFCCTEDDFKRIVAARGVPAERIITVSGWYNQTLNHDTRERYGIRSAALVHVDCDLYESAKSVLEFITPILVDGSIIIFDDWYNHRGHPDRGEQRACREWLESHPGIRLSQYDKDSGWNNSFIVHRADCMEPDPRPGRGSTKRMR